MARRRYLTHRRSRVIRSGADSGADGFRAGCVLVVVVALCGLVAWGEPPVAAATAPASSTIVYAFTDWDSPSGQSIRTVALSGGSGRELVAGEGLRRSPSWSRDGQRIAYITATELIGTAAMVVMASDGSVLQTVRLGDIEDVYHADWSPDGETIVFIAHEPGKDNGGRLSLYSVSLTSGLVTRITTGAADTHPTWSPDGEWIVFGSGGHLDVVDAQGGQRKRLSVARTRYVPSWSPDRSTIAYIRGDRHILRVDSDGSDRETITVLQGVRLGDLSWYPAGKSLLFTSTAGGVRRISRVDIDGSNLETIVETREGRFGRPRLFIPTLGTAHRWSAASVWAGLKQAPEER